MEGDTDSDCPDDGGCILWDLGWVDWLQIMPSLMICLALLLLLLLLWPEDWDWDYMM